ncbi:MAG: cryptochrome/photolyase family protein [Pirellulales bacterium]
MPASALLVFPHQLYASHPGLTPSPGAPRPPRVVLVEDSLFFGDANYPARFHRQKLWLHRASMRRYADRLRRRKLHVDYVDYDPRPGSLARVVGNLAGEVSQLVVADPTDFILERRLQRAAQQSGVQLHVVPNPNFLNTRDENSAFRRSRRRWLMADFYRWQRQRRKILVTDAGEPVGGRWSFDDENRRRVPAELLRQLPEIPDRAPDELEREAREYVLSRFPDAIGSIDHIYYPTSHEEAECWLNRFLARRLDRFGDFEDAIVAGESWLWHSVLTPSLNIGLLSPEQIVAATLTHAADHDVPLNSLEGFLRQVIGWREFMRATYEDLGVTMRTTNHWGHHRRLPNCFYDATTGIDPIDDTISRLLRTGYCHHIERLMVLGGFMFLCEIDPNDIYRWFMELFVDSYDWVMVPNVYAMSQHADGGQITTKPYFSGSAYVKKMSNHASGPWCEIWDALYWRWILNHADSLGRNPRWAMMCRQAVQMPAEKQELHRRRAADFLARLDAG